MRGERKKDSGMTSNLGASSEVNSGAINHNVKLDVLKKDGGSCRHAEIGVSVSCAGQQIV